MSPQKNYTSANSTLCETTLCENLLYEQKYFFQEIYGAVLKVDRLPNKADFEYFDANSNGILFYDEWEASF